MMHRRIQEGYAKPQFLQDQRSWKPQVNALQQDHAREFCIRLQMSADPFVTCFADNSWAAPSDHAGQGTSSWMSAWPRTRLAQRQRSVPAAERNGMKIG